MDKPVSQAEAARLFVQMLKSECLSSIVQSVVETLTEGPPGGQPDPEQVKWHKWFQSLPEVEQAHIQGIVRYGIDLSLFGLLNVFDGSSGRYPVDQISNFAVYLQTYKNDDDEAENKASSSVHVNPPYPWPDGEHLHDIYTELVP